LRGGGGNFGVCTEFLFKPSPVASSVPVARMNFDTQFAPAVLSAYAAFTSARPRDVDGVHSYLFLSPSSAYVIVVDVAPAPASQSTLSRDLLSPFLSIPHTWFDVSRLPLAHINSMHDEGNAAGRWYNLVSPVCAAASARDALLITFMFQLQLVPIDFCPGRHPQTCGYAGVSRALAADRDGFDCKLSEAKEVFDVGCCTARQASLILGNHAFGRSYFAQVQLRYSICAQVCDRYSFAVATEHIFPEKRITKSTRLFRG
jgi:hypothetical protein